MTADLPARGFPAFPAQRRGTAFAGTWWGRAWIRTVEETVLNTSLTKAGRAYAKRGLLGPVALSPGRIAATAEEHHPVVKVPLLDDAAWAEFTDAVTARAGHLSALLSGSLPEEIADATRILPWTLEFDCDCGTWECRHALALAYQTSWLLDADPFLLPLLRGRDLSALLAAPARGDDADAVWAAAPAPLPPRLAPVPLPAGLDGPLLEGALRARTLLGWAADSVGGGR